MAPGPSAIPVSAAAASRPFQQYAAGCQSIVAAASSTAATQSLAAAWARIGNFEVASNRQAAKQHHDHEVLSHTIQSRLDEQQQQFRGVYQRLQEAEGHAVQQSDQMEEVRSILESL